MGEGNSLMPEQPSPSEAERRRIRDLSRYYCTIPSSSGVQPRANNHNDGSPFLSTDLALNGLAQLAVYRFGCDRAFVSLIDGENQHIISEVTKSISLRDGSNHQPQDGIYLGVSTLDLTFGVCPDAVKLFTGQSVPALKNTANMTVDVTRFIVRDFTKEPHFRDRPYVTQWPYFRFYAEVPIYSPSGHVLGSFCVVDNKPRQEFSNQDAIALQEISDSISAHLENVRTVHYHHRSDRLVHGLTGFAKHRFDHPVADEQSNGRLISDQPSTTLPAPLERQHVIESADFRTENAPRSPQSTTKKSISSSSLIFSDCSTEITCPTNHEVQSSGPLKSDNDLLIDRKPSTEATESVTTSNEANISMAPLVTVKENIATSKQISAIFSYASSLIRESMDLDGVLFVDASHSNPGKPRTDANAWEPLPKTEYRTLSGTSLLQTLSSPAPDEPCETLGLDTGNCHRGSSPSFSDSSIPASLLRRLVASFPNGEVFHLRDIMDQAQVESSDTISDKPGMGRVEFHLRQHFPGADSVIFLPLWDWDKAQWLAGTFLWTGDKERALGLEELDYFKIFSDSITSEVARINWSRQEQSKSRFISSISHELRSPLHGILASAELLSGTTLNTEQQNFVNMLETCGQTLLDTMNHLLDFSKINNLTTSNGAGRAFKGESATNLVCSFDLGVLVEDVVKTMHLGNIRHSNSGSFTIKDGQDETSKDKEPSKGKLSVVVRIEPNMNWKIRSVSGAWRRIIMNLVGNALKYTDAGFVEISLSQVRGKSENENPTAQLSVIDSGCGISQEYQRHKLFSPFSQDDHLSEGVGLGLCMVHQLVTSLNGSIDLKSEPGIGTQVDILVPMELHETTAPASSDTTLPKPTKFCLVGLNAYSDLKEAPTGTLSVEAKRRLSVQSFFTHLITAQPGWSVSFAETLEQASGDVIIVEESPEEKGCKQVSTSLELLNSEFTRFLLLPDTISTHDYTKISSKVLVTHLSLPFCPSSALETLRKLSISEGQPKAPLNDALVMRKKIDVTGEKEEATQLPTKSSECHNVPHVLIVDDNPINVKVLSMYMRKIGWTCDTASDGLVALNKYKESHANLRLVLMDISMPVMDGVEATRNIRLFEEQRSLKPVKIFAITGVGSTVTRQQAVAAGVDNYMIKPLSLEQLKQACGNL